MTNPTERVIALQGASNFRDLGGYIGREGRTLRWGWLYRSDHLAQLTATDLAQLHQRGIGRSLDFRGVQESQSAAYELPGITRHALSIEPTVAQRMQALETQGQTLTEALTEGLMEDLYRNVVRNNSPRMAEFFSHVLAADHPLVFHCTAGKDRTGIAAALLLTALGVPQAQVMQDFLLTNRYFRPPTPTRHLLPAPVLQALWSVRPAYLHAGLEVIDTEFGGMSSYLREVLGLGNAQLHELQRKLLA